MNRLSIALISIAIALSTTLLISCASPLPPQPPAKSPIPTPAPKPPKTIPDDFLTYTEEGLYSISYPSEWESLVSRIEKLEERVKEIVESESLEISIEEVVYLFMAGRPYKGHYMPNFVVAIESVPYETSLDDYVEGTTITNKESLEDFFEFSRTKTYVGERPAIIQSYQGVFRDTSVRLLAGFILDGNICWIITCGSTPDAYGLYEDDFHSIINSFRLLK